MYSVELKRFILFDFDMKIQHEVDTFISTMSTIRPSTCFYVLKPNAGFRLGEAL